VLANLPLWAYILITLFLTHVTIAAVTIYLHRHQAHRALDLHPAASHFFRFWLWLTTGMVTKEWVAIHRKHHAEVETDQDPHSPQQSGILKVLLQGTELYRAEAKNQATLEKYGHGAPDDWIERRLYSRFPTGGVTTLLVLDVLLFGVIGITMWAVQMMWIPFWAAGVINGMGHWWGYRNYELPDASRNIIPFGLLIGGEELHNNHHAFASSARFSSKWYEIDMGWSYIRCLQLLRLARVKKVAPRPRINRQKKQIDLDTVQAVVSNRMHVMSHYAKAVLNRVYKEERAKANNLSARHRLRRGRRGLLRHEFILDSQSMRRLRAMLAKNAKLRTVHEYKHRLQQLWQEKTATQEALKHSLQEWCQQAEATGIKALEEFAAVLRGYTLQPAG